MQKNQSHIKKEEFHQRIRRNQLQKYFQQRRQVINSSGSPIQDNKLQYQMKQIINHIITGLYFVDYAKTINALNNSIHLQKEQINKMAFWLNFNHNYLNEKKIIFPDLLGRLLERNGWSLGEQPKDYPNQFSLSQELYYEMVWPEIPAEVYYQIAYLVLEYFKGICRQLLSEQVLINIMNNLWKIHGNSDIIELEDLSNPKYVINVIEIIDSSIRLASTNSFKKYKQLGLSSRLCQWIKTCQKSSCAIKIILLNIMENYCKLEAQNTQPQQQILVLGISAAQNQTFLLFGIWFLENNVNDAYRSVLSSMISILRSHQYLVQSIPYQYYDKIMDIIVSNNRQISTLALVLINDVIYYSVNLTQQFFQIGNGKILDIIYSRCQIQQHIKDEYSKESLNNINIVLCNILLVRKPKLKKLIKVHSIWQLIYNSISEQHALFPLVKIYQYYFPFIGRKEALPIFQSYIYAISCLDMHSVRQEIREIRKTVQNIYMYAEKYWGQKDYEFIVMILEKYKMSQIVNELQEQNQ